MKIAIIGSGISGNTLAYYLNPHHQIALFESNDRIGGHSHTHHIDVFNQKVSVDTGFIVFNKKTYPNFLKLLHELKVPYENSAMSFSVKDSQKDFEYNGTNLNALFAQRKNFINPSFYKMIREILRFNKSSIILLSGDEEISLGDYLKREGYSDFFKKYYILPMGSAIWSSNIKTMMQFPAKFFIQFFNNHGMLNINDRPQWLTISGGSINYVDKMIKPFRKKIKLNQNIKYVERKKDHIAIHHKDRVEKFDWVFFACHSDEALKLIKSPSFHEKNILKAIPYTDNEVILHYDDHFMPKRKLAWAAWNYHIDDNANSPASLTYNMNILQNLKTEVPLLVTLNPLQKINKKKIIKTLSYAHPQYSLRSIEAQSKYHLISGVNRTSFAGAYWGNGFHEDGVKSALDAIQQFNAVHGFQ
ncbi:NAD(P)/FAD-dependent oxidoreductase [Candidatus Methylopumilus rimovensis]|jgi:predicted NAD/FAD-binding protein|uniref:NAD(P)/FAD-dependent oxidoreductase n=1 Tax=Candidatus Methylopumilus rimovensis TaxID=2588535 RepID=UPI001124B2A0|nr:FAD-dependent oxidoreductase [Candidatus Methylopumilus rimovensis]QDD11764.1 FAD-dependent oxidoreductase [Candidatus Methylopumilus rimovensis]